MTGEHASPDERAEEAAKQGGSAIAFALAAVGFDALLVLGSRLAVRFAGSELRSHLPLLRGYCLTWSFWAPLLMSVMSMVSIWLAFKVPAYSIPRGSLSSRILLLARVIAILATVGWLLTTLIVAYANANICTID